jgi:hypothetical protein
MSALGAPHVEYSCTRCSWRGSEPMWTEENGEPVIGDDGRAHEPITHKPVCRCCYAPCNSVLVAGNNRMTNERGIR